MTRLAGLAFCDWRVTLLAGQFPLFSIKTLRLAQPDQRNKVK